jgi:hypothetical protein
MLKKSVPFLVVLLLGGGSCVPARHSGRFPDVTAAESAEAAAEAGGDVPGGEAAAAAAGPLLGIWAEFEQTGSCVDALGARVENLSWSWSVLAIRETMRDEATGQIWVAADSRLCSVVLTPIMMDLGVTVSQAIVDSVPVATRACALAPGAGWSFAELPAGWTLACEPSAETWGYQAADPIAEAVPATLEDPRVFDQDQDGKPAVTLVLGDHLCDMFVVQRTVVTLAGQFAGPGHAVGDLDKEYEQLVLAGSEPLCEASNQSTVNPARSFFHLVRVDGYGGAPDADADHDGQVTCGELLAAAPGLFESFGFSPDEPDSKYCDQQ